VALNLDRFRVIIAEADYALAADDLTTAEKFYALAFKIRPQNHEASAGLQSVLRQQQQALATARKRSADSQ
jgi:hypothetical protein